MRTSFKTSWLSRLAISSVFAFATLIASPFISQNTVQAEGYKHGTYNLGKRVRPKTPAINTNMHRSGVRVGYGKHYRKKPAYNYYVKKRQREIARRNIRVERQNQLRRLKASTRRSGPNGRFLSQRERVEILNDNVNVFEDEFISSSQGGVELRATSNCPSKHNCGFRIYEDGTGPRIITPGVYLNKNLPGYDGVRGPKIITLD